MMRSGESWLWIAAITLSTGCLQVLGLNDYRDGAGGGSASATATNAAATATAGTAAGGSGPCTPGQSYPCYDGPSGTEMNGICHAGTHVCDATGMGYGPCMDEQLPQAEVCSTPDDEDCNGFGCGQTTWAHGYPTSIFGLGPTHIAAAPDGSLYVAFTFSEAFMLGGTNLIPTGTSSGALARFDSQGNVVWAKNLGTEVRSVAANAMGPVVSVTGQIVRFDPNGAQQWTATCGPDWTGVVSFDGQGNVLDGANVGDLAHDCGSGSIPAVPSGFAKILLSKFSPTGVSQWGVLLKSTQDVALLDLEADAAGNALFTGWSEGTLNWGPFAEVCKGRDAFVAKFSPSGSHVWSSIFGDASYQEGHSIGVDSLGNPVIGGYFGGTVDFGGGPMTAPGTNQYGFIAKLGNFGAYQWAHSYAGSNEDVSAIAIDANGATVFVGTTTGTTDLGGGMLPVAGSNVAGFVAKLDPSGGYAWGRLISPSGVATQLDLTVDGNGFVGATGDYGGAMFDPGGGSLPAPTSANYNTFVTRVAP